MLVPERTCCRGVYIREFKSR